MLFEEAEREERAAARLAELDSLRQENAQLQQATRRAVRRWVQACLAGAFLGWVDAVARSATTGCTTVVGILSCLQLAPHD